MASMDTDQVLDLFSVSAADGEPSSSSKKKAISGPISQKALLDGLGELQETDDYADFDAAKFAASL